MATMTRGGEKETWDTQEATIPFMSDPCFEVTSA